MACSCRSSALSASPQPALHPSQRLAKAIASLLLQSFCLTHSTNGMVMSPFVFVFSPSVSSTLGLFYAHNSRIAMVKLWLSYMHCAEILSLC